MSVFESLPGRDRLRLKAASRWTRRIQADPLLAESPDFRDWVAKPANRRAFTAVERTLANLDALGGTPRIVDMRRAGLARLRKSEAQRWPRRQVLVRSAATVVLTVFAGEGLVFVGGQVPKAYATDVGERRVIALPDGSRIVLDSASKVEVRYTKAARMITLERGRARFDVAHDALRPLTVTAGAKTVVAVGTSFNVERLNASVLVTLIEGRILIKDASGSVALKHSPPKPAIVMVAGEQMAAVDGLKPVVTPADLDTATAWEAGHLVFRGEPLGDAVQRVNRYTDHPILVDPPAAAIRISGVFNVGDTGAFVSAITGYFPIDAISDSSATITLRRRS